MADYTKCPKCGTKTFWQTKDGSWKCKRCLYTTAAYTPPARLDLRNVIQRHAAEVTKGEGEGT